MDSPKAILLVEDDRFLAMLMKSRLEKAGFGVTPASDGSEALDFLKSRKFDLLILDLVLPQISGFELLEHAEARAPLAITPVMVLSNLAQESDAAKVIALGVKKYLIKSRVSTEEVVRIADALIGVIEPALAGTPAPTAGFGMA